MIEKIIAKLQELEVYNEIITSDKHPFCASEVEMVSKKEVLEIVKEVAAEYNNGWIPVEVRLPEHNIDVEVTLANGQRHICWYSGLRQEWIDAISDDESELNVIAWKEPSEPYQNGE